MSASVPADPMAHDLEALQGVWRQVAFEENGEVGAADEFGDAGIRTTIRGRRFRVCTADGTCLLEGAFTLDATASPRAITWIDSMGPDAGRPLAAIYALHGDRFAFVAADAGMPRPARFAAGPGLTMRDFVRAG